MVDYVFLTSCNSTWYIILFFFFLNYLLLAALGLHHFVLALSSSSEQGLRSRCSAWASHCGGFSRCGAWAPGAWASVAGAHELSHCVLHGLSCLAECGIDSSLSFVQPGILHDVLCICVK